MKVKELNDALSSHRAVVVHCSRPSRSGETTEARNPLYPRDLIETIRDLETGNVREVSCSVVWLDHLETFGAVGIVLEPQEIGDIARMLPTDAGTLPGVGGFGVPPSKQALAETFHSSDGHNEWVLVGARVRGIFVNPTMDLMIARVVDIRSSLGVSEEEAISLGIEGETVEPCYITLSQIRMDFPNLPILTYVDGELQEV